MTKKILLLLLINYVMCSFFYGAGFKNIIKAVKNDDLKLIKKIVGDNAGKVNEKDSRSCTPLHHACSKGSVKVVEYLVKKGADLNAQDTDGDIPITWALVRGHKNIAKFLINKGANVKLINKKKMTLLHWVVICSDKEMAEIIIDKGVLINAMDFENRTALHYAGERQKVELAGILLKNGADVKLVGNYGRTPLILTARQNGNTVIMKKLIDHGANINAVDKFGDSALTLAAWRGYEKTVNLLLDNGIKIPEDKNQQWSLMLYSVSKNMEKLFDIMLEKNIDLMKYNEEGGRLIHNAARGGNIKIMRRLLKKKFDINLGDMFGLTPLHYAAKNGNIKIMKLLYEKKCKINKRNFTGESAYNIAVKNKRTESAKYLKRIGAETIEQQFPVLKGDYFGQKKQKKGVELFARGIVATQEFSHSPIAFSPKMDEAFWPSSVLDKKTGFGKSFLLYAKKVNGVWSKPQKVPFSSKYGEKEPFYSVDGRKLYFISERPIAKGARPGSENFWFVNKTKNGWSKPQPLPQIINKMRKHWQFSIDKDENIYFGAEDPGGYGKGDIYILKKTNGKYVKPENLGKTINSKNGEFCPVIAPDGSYMIFTSDKEGISLYISFRGKYKWSNPVRLSDHLPELKRSLGAQISPDGKYLFFLGQEYGIDGICWVEIKDTIKKIKNKIKGENQLKHPLKKADLIK